MSAPFQRHYATARSGNAGSSGMRMALDCARNVYEAVDRRMPEAAALVNWLGQNAAAFGLSDTAIPDDEAPRRSRRGGVPVPDWRKVGSALVAAEADPRLKRSSSCACCLSARMSACSLAQAPLPFLSSFEFCLENPTLLN